MTVRILKILEQINMLFEESEFELTTGGRKSKDKKDKLRIGLNLNGTVTVAAPCRNDGCVFITFNGTETVEIWNGGIGFEVFWLEDDTYTPEELRRNFRTKLEKEYGFEFKSGGHHLITSDFKYTFLPTAKMIPPVLSGIS